MFLGDSILGGGPLSAREKRLGQGGRSGVQGEADRVLTQVFIGYSVPGLHVRDTVFFPNTK